VLGVATAAPVMTDVEHALPIIGSVNAANPVIVMLVEAFHASYPQFDDASLLSADALTQAPIVEQKCFVDIARTYPSSPDLALAHNPLENPAMATILHRNSAANRPAGAPLLVVQGTADVDVPQINSDLLVAKACGTADTVDYRVVAGADHLGVISAAADDVAAWFADRTRGIRAASTCS